MEEVKTKYSELEGQDGFISIDNIENAIDSLETALFLLSRSSDRKWKWISITIHHSLYSFCISYIHKGNYERVSRINKITGKRELISFEKAINKVLNTPYYSYSKLKDQKNRIKLTQKERDDINWLSYEIRNSFTHFIPQVTSIDIKKIKSVCLTAINIIEIVAIKSYSLVYIDNENSQNRIQKSIDELKKHLSE